MKHLKKLASVLLALVMVMALAAPAFAEENADPTGSITITKPDGVDEVATYNVYEVFGLTLSAPAGPSSSFAYTATDNIKNLITGATGEYLAVASYFTFSRPEGSTGNWNVTPNNSYDEAAAKIFSQFLADNKNHLGTPVETVTVGEGSADGLPYGYYFVDSTVGSLCMLNSSTPDVTIEDKNEQPPIEKTVTVVDQDKIGSTVEYKIEIVVKDGVTDYTVSDVMDNGLTYDNTSLEVKADGTDVAYTNENTLTAPTGKTEIFRLKISKDTLVPLVGKTITITYSAKINKDAIVTQGNTATLEYGNGHKVDDSAEVRVYDIPLEKVDDKGNQLEGAKFELYEAETGGEKIALIKEGTGDDAYYRPATDNEKAGEGFESAVIEAGNVTIKGLCVGTYYLEEIEAPSGYNKLTGRVAVKISETLNDTTKEYTGKVQVQGGGNAWTDVNDVQVENKSGTQLPSTGGIGTTIFYVVGGVLMVGAVVVLIAKRRTGSDEE